MLARTTAWVAVLALSGCSALFDGSRYETGTQAPPCDLMSDQCCSWVQCDGHPDGPFCSFDADRWSCESECDDNLDCRDFPAGHACVMDGGMRVCGCERDTDCQGAVDGEVCLPMGGGTIDVCGCDDDDDCTTPDFPTCGRMPFGIPMCLVCADDGDCAATESCVMGFCQTSCMDDGDCAGGDRCIDSACQPCDQDGDGFEVPACNPVGPPDCDDSNAQVGPGAAPLCGSTVNEDCDGRWGALEMALGVQEVGVAATFMASGPSFEGTTNLSVVVPEADVVLVAAHRSGPPRIFRTAPGGGLNPLGPPSNTDLTCSGIASTIETVQAIQLAADEAGQVFLAVAGLAGTEMVTALFSLRGDDTWMLGACAAHRPITAPLTRRALDVAIAPDAETVVTLWQGVAEADSEVQWMSPTGSGTYPNQQSGPHWVGGSGQSIAGRQVDMGAASAWFIDERGSRVSHPLGAEVGTELAGRGAFARAPTGQYAHLIGTTAELTLLRGRCSFPLMSAMCPPPTLTTLDESWPPSATSLYAGADLGAGRDRMVIAHVGVGPSRGEEIQLTAVPYTDPIEANRQFAPVFAGPDMGMTGGPFTVLDLAVDTFRADDTSDIAVAFLVDDGGSFRLGVRLLHACDVR